MVSRPQRDIPSLQYMGTTYSGSYTTQLNNKIEAFFHTSQTLWPCTEFSAGGLVEGSTVHLSPIAPSAPCSSQGNQGGRSGHCDSTVATLERMDSPSLASPCGPASVATRVRWSSPRPRWASYPISINSVYPLGDSWEIYPQAGKFERGCCRHMRSS